MDKPSLMSALASKTSSEEDHSEPDGDESPHVQAAQVIMEAIQDGDAEGLADALKSFCTMHGTGSESGSMGSKPALVVHLGHKE